MTCYIIRHGADDDTIRGGWSNTVLSEQGILEVQTLAQTLVADSNLNITHIFSSDLLRARQTAEILAEALHVDIIYLPEFREVNNGVLAGMKNDLAAVRFPGLFWNTLGWDECYPEGESPHQFYDRVSAAWTAFKHKMRELDGNAALVTHGGVINMIYSLENGICYSNQSKPFSIKNAGIYTIDLK